MFFLPRATAPQVASFLEARVDLAVKAMATLTSGAKSIAANTDEIKRTAGAKMLQLERNLEGALRDREGTKVCEHTHTQERRRREACTPTRPRARAFVVGCC